MNIAKLLFLLGGRNPSFDLKAQAEQLWMSMFNCGRVKERRNDGRKEFRRREGKEEREDMSETSDICFSFGGYYGCLS